MVVSNRILLFQGSIFRCYVSFKEGIWQLNPRHFWCEIVLETSAQPHATRSISLERKFHETTVQQILLHSKDATSNVQNDCKYHIWKAPNSTIAEGLANANSYKLKLVVHYSPLQQIRHCQWPTCHLQWQSPSSHSLACDRWRYRNAKFPCRLRGEHGRGRNGTSLLQRPQQKVPTKFGSKPPPYFRTGFWDWIGVPSVIVTVSFL